MTGMVSQDLKDMLVRLTAELDQANRDYQEASKRRSGLQQAVAGLRATISAAAEVTHEATKEAAHEVVHDVPQEVTVQAHAASGSGKTHQAVTLQEPVRGKAAALIVLGKHPNEDLTVQRIL